MARKKYLSLYLWHRVSGVIIALFLLIMSLSGLALNHSHDWSLDNTHISANTARLLYDIKPELIERFVLKNKLIEHELIDYSNNGVSFYQNDAVVVGISAIDDYFIIAFKDSMAIFNDDFELVDELNEYTGLPVPILRVGVSAGEFVIKTTQGLFALSDDLEQWHQVVNVDIHWSIEPQKMMSEKSHLTIERLLLDIHNGNLFSQAGKIILDLIAIMTTFMVFSGLLIRVKQKHKQRQHKRKHKRRKPRAV